MALYTMTDSAIAPVTQTTFGAAGIRERADMQRLLKENVGLVAPDTLVIAEEFGSWDVSYRRIDLLGIDKDSNLVVIELKRDETGAHMELQALRYAAMVARMTFDQAVAAYQKYLPQPATTEDARAALLQFLEQDEPDEASFAQDVRIVLVAADFSRELTTSVMWLNERELDIRCVQLKPYKLGEQLLLDIEQVIPLREAGEYQVQVREKARRERAASSGTADWTQYDLSVGDQSFTQLPKRRLIYRVVRHIIETQNKTPEDLATIIGRNSAWVSLPGTLDSDAFVSGLLAQARNDGTRVDPNRFFKNDDELLHINGRTYAFTKMWGTNTLSALEALTQACPGADIVYTACV
jgi:hypothetical protein